MSACPVMKKIKPAGLVLLFFAACFSPATAPFLSAQTLPQSSFDQKIKDFMTLVSSPDFASEGLSRWESPLKVVVVSPDPARDVPMVERELSSLRSDTGLDISIGKKANVGVIFTKNPKEDITGRYLPLFRRFFKPQGDPRKIVDQFANKSSVCFPMYGMSRQGGHKVVAAGLIVIKEGLDGATIHGCLARSFYRVLGLFMDTEPGRPSTFSESSKFWEPTDLDRVMIRTLYDRRLQSGMKRAEVEAQVKAVLSESVVDDSAKVLDLFTETAIGEVLKDGIVRKWNKPIRAVLEGQYPPEAVAQAAAQIERLAKATGLDFRLAEKGENPNLVLLFTDNPQTDLTGPFRALATQVFHAPIEKSIAENYDSGFAQIVFDGNTIGIVLAVMPRPTAPAMFDWHFSRSLIMSLGLGLTADPSKRSAYSSMTSTINLTETDLRAIAALYSPEVRAGMNREEAIEAASAAIARISASRSGH